MDSISESSGSSSDDEQIIDFLEEEHAAPQSQPAAPLASVNLAGASVSESSSDEDSGDSEGEVEDFLEQTHGDDAPAVSRTPFHPSPPAPAAPSGGSHESDSSDDDIDEVVGDFLQPVELDLTSTSASQPGFRNLRLPASRPESSSSGSGDDEDSDAGELIDIGAADDHSGEALSSSVSSHSSHKRLGSVSSAGSKLNVLGQESQDWFGVMEHAYTKASATPAQTELFFASMTPVDFRDGDFIVRQGEMGDAFFIIETGSVTIEEQKAEEEEPRVLARLYPGHHFGELSVLNRQPRVASVVARGPAVRCREFRKATLDSFSPEDQEAFRRVIGELVAETKKKRDDRAKVKASAYTEQLRFVEQKRNDFRVRDELSRRRTDDRREMINEYLVLKKLGEGSFGVVKLAENTDNGDIVALKVINKAKLRRRRLGITDEELMREVDVMRRLRNENIVTMREAINDAKHDLLIFVEEYMSLGPVMEEAEECAPLNESLAREYFRSTLRGLEYLHFQRVVHRDIKPANILVDAEGNAKLADFGVAAVLPEGETRLRDVQGTPAFMAPELFSVDMMDYNGFAVDVWALGATLYNLVTGRPPFLASSQMELAEKLQNERPSFPLGMDPHLKNLISIMMEKDPVKRATLSVIMRHEWVTIEGTDPLPPIKYVRVMPATETPSLPGRTASRFAKVTQKVIAAKRLFGSKFAMSSESSSETPSGDVPLIEVSPGGGKRKPRRVRRSSLIGISPSGGDSETSSGRGSADLTSDEHEATPALPLLAVMSGVSAEEMNGLSRASSTGTLGSKKSSSLSAEKERAEAARKAHLQQLRRRQVALLKGHKGLSVQDRDILMDQQRIAIHASRAEVAVASFEIVGTETEQPPPLAEKIPMNFLTGDISQAPPPLTKTLTRPTTEQLSFMFGHSDDAVPSPAHSRRSSDLLAQTGSDGSNDTLGMYVPSMARRLSRRGSSKLLRSTAAVTSTSSATPPTPALSMSPPASLRRGIPPPIPSSKSQPQRSAPQRTQSQPRVGVPSATGISLDMESEGPTQVIDVTHDDFLDSPPIVPTRMSRADSLVNSLTRSSSSSDLHKPSLAMVISAQDHGLIVKTSPPEKSWLLQTWTSSNPGETPHLLSERPILSSLDSMTSLRSPAPSPYTPGISVEVDPGLQPSPSPGHFKGSITAIVNAVCIAKRVRRRSLGMPPLPAQVVSAIEGGTSNRTAPEEESPQSDAAAAAVVAADAPRTLRRAKDFVMVTEEIGRDSSGSVVKKAVIFQSKDSSLSLATTNREALRSLPRSSSRGKNALKVRIAQTEPLQAVAEESELLGAKLAKHEDSDDSSLSSPVSEASSDDSDFADMMEATDVMDDLEDVLGELLEAPAEDPEVSALSDMEDDESDSDDSDLEAVDVTSIPDESFGDAPASATVSKATMHRVVDGVHYVKPVLVPNRAKGVTHISAKWPGVMQLRASDDHTNLGMGIRFVAAADQGKRASMEDRMMAIGNANRMLGLPEGYAPQAFFGVYDGHSGDETSRMLADRLHVSLYQQPMVDEEPDEALKHAFMETDGAWIAEMAAQYEAGTASKFSGSTAIAMLMREEDIIVVDDDDNDDSSSSDTREASFAEEQRRARLLYVANAGDCRAVLCRAGWAVDLSEDHKASLAAEKARVEAAGGWVHNGRVNGVLAVTRAFGDPEYKVLKGKAWEQEFSADIVSAEPDVRVEEITVLDEFVITACDGLWDVMTSQQAVNFVRRQLRLSADLEAACEALVNKAIELASADNVSAVIVAFNQQAESPVVAAASSATINS
jgi:serine/threonine protein kinase/serine/threonine protein phosphatase PrpC